MCLLDALEGFFGELLLILVGVQLEREPVERLLRFGRARISRDPERLEVVTCEQRAAHLAIG